MGFFRRSKAREPDPNLVRLSRDLDEAEVRHLQVLRREIANLLVAVDPDLMARCYERVWNWERETAKAPDRLHADELALVSKIKAFGDFDPLATRHFVPYAEARKMTSDDDLVERYTEIGRMLVFVKNRSGIETVRQRPLHDAQEHELLLDRMRSEKNRRFRVRIEDALKRCRCYQAGYDAGKGERYAGLYEIFSDAEVEVVRLAYGSTPENETGVTFKKTDEFGVYAFFVHDNGRAFETYYRSDRQFQTREALN